MSRVGTPGWNTPAPSGYAPSPADVLTEQRDRLAAGAQNHTPLATLFPVFIAKPAYFNQITVPAGLSIAAGSQALYGLRQIRFRQDVGFDALLSGVYGQLVSADVTGAGISGQISAAAGAGTALPWGDRTGSSAAIIIGKKLGIKVGGWTSGRVYMPGIELTTAGAPNADTLLSPNQGDGYPVAINFPPGAWSDTTPSVLPLERNMLPMVQRFSEGDTLDIALAVAGGQVNNLAASRVICGRGYVQVALLPTEWLDEIR